MARPGRRRPARHSCINSRFPGSGSIYRWEFEKKGKKLELAVAAALISNQDVVIERALQASAVSTPTTTIALTMRLRVDGSSGCWLTGH
jgi:hypothetical protein